VCSRSGSRRCRLGIATRCVHELVPTVQSCSAVASLPVLTSLRRGGVAVLPQQFMVRATLVGLQGVNDVTTDPIRVLSKHTRHNRKRKRAAKAAADTDGFDAVLAKEDPVKLTVDVLGSLEWLRIGQDKSVLQCPSCTAVHLVGVNNKLHKPRCKLRHLISVFARAPQGGAAAGGAVAAGTAAAAANPRSAKTMRTQHNHHAGAQQPHHAAPAAVVAPVGLVMPAQGRPAGAGVGAGAGATPVLASQPSFDFEKELALELVDSMPEAGEQSTLGKLARNFSIGSLVRSFSWGRGSSDAPTMQQKS